MPKHKRKEPRSDSPDFDSQNLTGTKPSRSKSAGRRSEGENGKMDVERHGVPRWRQIEIMRERAQLREALGGLDLYDDMDDYESEVFGSEEDNEILYDHSDDGEEVDVDIDDDDFESDDFEDFEED